jgi:DNA polymerase III subunit alpha
VTTKQKFKPLAMGWHSHTHYSSDASSTPKQKLQRAQELGRPAEACTDHGNMSGLIPSYLAAQELSKKGPKIQSIHGIELYCVDERRPATVYKNGRTQSKYTHLTIMFKTQKAYEYMCEMTPIMEERGKGRSGGIKPLLYLHELEPISGEIAIGSSCLAGAVSKNINDFSMTYAERLHYAEEEYLKLKKLSGSQPLVVEIFPIGVTHNQVKGKAGERSFFKPILEPHHICSQSCDGIQHIEDECGHLSVPIDLQTRADLFQLEMAKKYGDLCIISEDSHMAYKSDKPIQTMKLSNSGDSWEYHQAYSMETTDEWADNLKKRLGVDDYEIEKWVDNSYQILDWFSGYKIRTNDDGWILPTAEMIYNIKDKTDKEVLLERIEARGLMPKPDHPDYIKYKERLDYEMSLFADNGVQDISGYFLPIIKMTEYAKENNILTGVRGSAAGSLVIYLLGASLADPLEFDLPIERMITMGRLRAKTPPDVDTDWPDRDVIIEYLRSLYGDKVSMIGTDLNLKMKSAMLDVERSVEGSVSFEFQKMVKSIPSPPQSASEKDFLFGYTDKDTDEEIPGFLSDITHPIARQLNEWSKQNKEKWSTVLKAIGILKSRGVHAGGVLITPKKVSSYFPMITGSKGLAAAYNMKYVESVGGIKYDILGLKTLKALGITLNMIAKNTGKKYEWKKFDHDPEVYKNVYHTGKLAGIYQLSTKTMAPFVSRLKPKSIMEIANICAVVRPGTLDAPAPDPSMKDISAAEYYIRVMTGEVKPFYFHEELRPILEETGSVLLFQEQTLKFARDLVGYTYETAEKFRRAMGKKDAVLLEQELEPVGEALKQRQWSDLQIRQMKETIKASARYSFNKAHAVSVAILSYNCAFLKHHHKLEYFCGMLTAYEGDDDDIKEFLNEAGHLVLPVDILYSHPTEWQIEGNKIRPPLSLLKGVGGKSVHALRTFINTPYELLTKELFDEISKDDIVEEESKTLPTNNDVLINTPVRDEDF